MIKLRHGSQGPEARNQIGRSQLKISDFRPQLSGLRLQTSFMKTKEEIVKNWLPRYTGEKLENFGKYLLLTNFSNYVGMFAEWNNVNIVGEGKPMQCATADNITIINFGMGSPTAATVM